MTTFKSRICIADSSPQKKKEKKNVSTLRGIINHSEPSATEKEREINDRKETPQKNEGFVSTRYST